MSLAHNFFKFNGGYQTAPNHQSETVEFPLRKYRGHFIQRDAGNPTQWNVFDSAMTHIHTSDTQIGGQKMIDVELILSESESKVEQIKNGLLRANITLTN